MTEQTSNPLMLLARYADGPAQLEAALAGLKEGDLDVALSPGTWTIRQIVHHIVDGDDVWKICIKAALGKSQGPFSLQWYWDIPQDTWVESWNYAGRAIEPSLALFRASRRHIAQLLEQIPGAWEQHTWLRQPNGEEEKITVGYVVEMQANHVVQHVKDVQAIREAHNL